MCNSAVLKQKLKQKVFFPLGETSTIGGCFCGFVVPGAPEAQREVDFVGPGIEPANPGLQGERLNHCTTVASQTESYFFSRC